MINATSLPRPAPATAAVTASISGIPGEPFGPSYRITITSPVAIRARRDGGERVLLGVERASDAFEGEALRARGLHDGAVRGEVAAEDRDAAPGVDRVADRMDDVAVGR